MRRFLLFVAACGSSSNVAIDAALDHGSDDARPDAPMLDAFAGHPVRPGACDPTVTPTLGTLTAHAKGSTCAQLGYYDYVPAAYDTAGNWPLLIEFHGDGQRGNGTTELAALLDDGLPHELQLDHWDPAHRFVVLAPQMDDRNGLPERTGPYVKAFIEFAIANYDVDPHRIYLTGYSGGAEPIYNYFGAFAGGVAAAAVPISGWYSTQGTECTWATTPMWYFHGAIDNFVPPAEHSTKSYNNLVACQGAPPPRYTLFTERGHDDWNITYDLTAEGLPVTAPGTQPFDRSIYDWLLQYTR